MSFMLPHLHNGWQVDQSILSEEDKVVLIRYNLLFILFLLLLLLLILAFNTTAATATYTPNPTPHLNTPTLDVLFLAAPVLAS